MYVATETFVCEIDGRQEWVRAGVTRVTEDHPLCAAYAASFRATEAVVPGVEQATAAPGEKRGAPAA